jgi:hypothetical protein
MSSFTTFTSDFPLFSLIHRGKTAFTLTCHNIPPV